MFVDPLFQKVVVEVCRARRIPVIFDEVFTGGCGQVGGQGLAVGRVGAAW